MPEINSFIDIKYDDRIFFYSTSIHFDYDVGWTIDVDPDYCLVDDGLLGSDLNSVSCLRSQEIVSVEKPNGVVFSGEILFSAGVLFYLEDYILLFERDNEAPTDPNKWTSAAGRSDREPLLTALKEFHEEVIIFDSCSHRPIYIDIVDNPYSQEVEDIYKKTLSRKGFDSDSNNWIKLIADFRVDCTFNVFPVKVKFGETMVDSSMNGVAEFFSFMDVKHSTLELLLPLVLKSSEVKDLKIEFCDGEYHRTFKLFSLTDFKKLPTERLVSTMVKLRDCYLKSS